MTTTRRLVNTEQILVLPQSSNFQIGDVLRVKNVDAGQVVFERLADITITIEPMPGEVIAGDWRIDSRAAVVENLKTGERVKLSLTEWKLLDLLIQERDRLGTFRRLLTLAWGVEYVDCTQYLRLYVSRLRTKMVELPLLTVNGRGYKLITDPTDPDFEAAKRNERKSRRTD